MKKLKKGAARVMKAVRLTRLDYATAPSAGGDLDVVIAKPRQVSVTMRTAYAAQLLRQLREAKLRRGECLQVSIDCPIAVSIDATTLGALVRKLEGEVGVEA